MCRDINVYRHKRTETLELAAVGKIIMETLVRAEMCERGMPQGVSLKALHVTSATAYHM